MFDYEKQLAEQLLAGLATIDGVTVLGIEKILPGLRGGSLYQRKMLDLPMLRVEHVKVFQLLMVLFKKHIMDIIHGTEVMHI